MNIFDRMKDYEQEEKDIEDEKFVTRKRGTRKKGRYYFKDQKLSDYFEDEKYIYF